MVNKKMHLVYCLDPTNICNKRSYRLFFRSENNMSDILRLQFSRNSNHKSFVKADGRGVFSSLRYKYIACCMCIERNRASGRSENLGGQSVIQGLLTEQVLLLNGPKHTDLKLYICAHCSYLNIYISNNSTGQRFNFLI